MKISFQNRGILMAASVAALLGGCTISLDRDSELAAADRQMQVVSDDAEMQLPVDAMNDSTIRRIAGDYASRGDGAMVVSVLYDPSSRSGTAMKAGQELARIVETLKQNNIAGVQGDIMPVQALGDRMQVLVSYDQLTAQVSDVCAGQEMDQTMTDLDKARAYPLGCTVDQMVARQTAQPADLLGRDPVGGTDGRRGAAVTEPYRAGEPNSELSGESASE
ncbi:CpaD family pilus assembly lipoprotein [Micavibrio aeruginosavorus]|uniref:CpaD family pilus assembly lipoprotein n=1 Tax=Micavibrio aeruginosavorus TaxID=349221 RepID=UPI003F4A8B6C